MRAGRGQRGGRAGGSQGGKSANERHTMVLSGVAWSQ